MSNKDIGGTSISELSVQVRFGALQSEHLYELARRKDPESRRELGNAVTDLFAHGNLSLREQDIVSDILITMLKQAELDLRRSIAERLAALDQAPLRVVLYLSNDDIQVAHDILAQSPVLEDMDLMLIIETQKSPYWQAIAERKDLRAQVVQALAETRDPPTARILVKNEDITIPQSSFRTLSETATIANDLYGALLKRADLPKDLVSTIYQMAGDKIGKDMQASLSAAQLHHVKPHIDDATQEFVNAAKGEHEPTPMMIDAAKASREKGRLTIDGMVQSLANGQIASFMAQMMVFLGIDVDQIKTILREESGVTMAAICRVHRVEKKTFLKLFLLTQKYRTGERVVDPMALNNALTEFDQMPLSDCRRRVEGLKK